MVNELNQAIILLPKLQNQYLKKQSFETWAKKLFVYESPAV